MSKLRLLCDVRHRLAVLGVFLALVSYARAEEATTVEKLTDLLDDRLELALVDRTHWRLSIFDPARRNDPKDRDNFVVLRCSHQEAKQIVALWDKSKEVLETLSPEQEKDVGSATFDGGVILSTKAFHSDGERYVIVFLENDTDLAAFSVEWNGEDRNVGPFSRMIDRLRNPPW